MAHCPECGAKVGDVVACPQCGTELTAQGGVSSEDAGRTLNLGSARARTIVGVAMPDPPPPAPDPAPSGAPKPSNQQANRTIVGMPATLLKAVGPSLSAQASGAAGGSPANRTIVGMAVPAGLAAAQAGSRANQTLLGGVSLGVPGSGAPDEPAPEAGGAVPSQSPTMIGVARPGIAPLRAGEPAPGAPAALSAAGELGATMGLPDARIVEAAQSRQKRPSPPEADLSPRSVRAPPPKPPSARAVAIIAAGGGLALLAVLIGIFWHGAPPLTALARVDAQGKEVLEVRCPGCPDGTLVTVSGGTATIAGHTAQVPLAVPLTVGENLLKVAIDRPGKGRDETVKVDVHVAYRIRPDLATLQGDRPAIQILVEAAPGTTVALDGQPVPLVNGHAIQTIDVTDACSGLSDDQTPLSRQIPYAVTTPDGVEKGTVNVSVGILPLHLDAPGPHAVTDGKSFVLAGRTLKGAEVLAAGRPIPVSATGAFAQVMNVSSVGATQIEVRAKMAGLAPRLTQIAVRRVDSLETAAAEFSRQTLVPFASLASDAAAQVGKPIVLGGEIAEVRRQNHQTVMLLDVASKSGCTAAKGSDACRVRLVQGTDTNPVKGGDLITVYGAVARIFSAAGKEIPEIQVDFTLKGIR